MGARSKINGLHSAGILLVAAFIGAGSQSWTIFFVAAGALFAIAIFGGDIRFDNRRRR